MVAENAKGRSKVGFSLNSACRAALTVLSALALPSAFTTQPHAADAANAGVTTTTINQTSQRLAIDWKKLSTASNEALVSTSTHSAILAA